MRLATLRRARQEVLPPGLHAVARVVTGAESTMDLAARIRPGDLAVIAHLDLDAGAARRLVDAGAAAVVNTSPTLSGRYPALGAQILVQAGVLLLDAPGLAGRQVANGDRVRLDGEHLYRRDEVLATGTFLTPERVSAAMERARAGLALQLESFAGTTAEHLRRERDLFLDGEGIPALRTPVAGRPVLVVAPGPRCARDLLLLHRWLADASPVVLGVDEGIDLARAAGMTPHVFVGNPEVVSEQALVSGIEVVVRSDGDGLPAGLDRADALGAAPTVFTVGVPAEDAALLLADAASPSYIVLAGSSSTVADFVDRTRPEMAGTFLARLKVGSQVVDAATLAAIHRPRPRIWPMWVLALLLLAGAVALVVLTGDATPLGEWRETVVGWASQLWSDLR